MIQCTIQKFPRCSNASVLGAIMSEVCGFPSNSWPSHCLSLALCLVPLANLSSSLRLAMSSSSAPSTVFINGIRALLQDCLHFVKYLMSGYWISEVLGLFGQRLTHVYSTWWAKWICPSFRSAEFNAVGICLIINSFLWLFPFELKAFYQVLGRRDSWLRSCEGRSRDQLFRVKKPMW